MTTPQSPSKAELLEALRSSGQQFVERARALQPEALDTERDGWNARQLIAHMAAIEWMYARYVQLARLGVPDDGWPPGIEWTAPDQAPDVPTMSARGGLDAFNAREVAKRAGASVAELAAEFERNREATLAAVERADEALLSTPVRTIGGVTGQLAAVLYRVAVEHVREHTEDLATTT